MIIAQAMTINDFNDSGESVTQSSLVALLLHKYLQHDVAFQDL